MRKARGAEESEPKVDPLYKELVVLDQRGNEKLAQDSGEEDNRRLQRIKKRERGLLLHRHEANQRKVSGRWEPA